MHNTFMDSILHFVSTRPHTSTHIHTHPHTYAVWRNNWGLAPNGILDQPLYGFGGGIPEQVPVEQRWLKTEYQTLRRLPKTNAILFTVRTFVEPLSSVPPVARQVLAESVRGMSSAMLEYKGIANAGKGGEEDEAEELLRVLGV